MADLCKRGLSRSNRNLECWILSEGDNQSTNK